MILVGFKRVIIRGGGGKDDLFILENPTHFLWGSHTCSARASVALVLTRRPSLESSPKNEYLNQFISINLADQGCNVFAFEEK